MKKRILTEIMMSIKPSDNNVASIDNLIT